MTGVLPVTLNDATKIVQALLFSGKEYVCIMRLHGDATEEGVKKVLREFEDVIYQRPPLRASVKRQLRTRRIYYLDCLEMEGRNVLFKAGCEGGTYIRKLCFDIGEALGCGAHMQELRRTRAGPFVEKDSVTLHDIAYCFSQGEGNGGLGTVKQLVKPMESALGLIPRIEIRDSAIDAVCHGASLTAPGALSVDSAIKKGAMIAIFSLKNEGVALAKSTVSADQIMEIEHGIIAEIKRVLMPRGTYPKGWKSGNKTDGRNSNEI